MNRRDFLTVAGGTLLAGGAGVLGVGQITARDTHTPRTPSPLDGKRVGMVVDLRKCRKDCRACLVACRAENNVAFHDDPRWDIHWIKKVRIKSDTRATTAEKPVILLCNHCERPPCAQVCPVQATYRRKDGIVIVDHHRCIGCRYCMVACPYGERYFNYKENPGWPKRERPRRAHGVTESCTLCAHRLDAGQKPACQEACAAVGANVITVGDLNDPESEVSKLIAENQTTRIREDLGTEPKVFYIGL